MPTINDIVIGGTISFRSKAVNDNNFYYGKVNGKVSSDIAVNYADIYTYNTSVQSADPAVQSVDTQTFLIMRLIEPVDNSTKYVIPFSLDWINEATLNIIASNKTALIKVYEVDNNNVQDVINLLKTGGFKSRVEAFQ
jgi:hypothetical protein